MDSDRIRDLLSSLTGKHGILGCLFVGSDGSVVASTMPEEVDIAMISALSATLFANSAVSIQRMNRGNLVQMTLMTDQGTLHFYETSNHFLVILTTKGQQINFEAIIRRLDNPDWH
jgi:predicted regulator of Ras-like GTPase activity (Roadblock/LC7/MglB family)